MPYLLAGLFWTFSAREADAWGWVVAESAVPTVYLGDKPQMSWLFNGDANGASYKAYALYPSSSSARWQYSDGSTYLKYGVAVGGDHRWTSQDIQVTNTGTWRLSLWIGWGGSVGDNGRYYDTSTSWNEGSGSMIYGTMTVQALGAPTFTQPTATAGATSVSLSWTKWNSKNVLLTQGTAAPSSSPSQGVGYVGNATIGNHKVVEGSTDATTRTVTGLTPGTTYVFALYSENYSYYSPAATRSVTIPLAAPTLTLTPSASMGLSWTAVNGAASYSIYRSETTTRPSTALESGRTTTTYTDSAVTPSKTYYYWVEAVGANTNSLSTRKNAATYAEVPAAPVLTDATADSFKAALQTGNNPTNVMYSLRVGTLYVQADGTLGAPALWQTASAWGSHILVKGLTSGTSYTVAVAARNSAAVETAYGTAASITTRLPSPVVISSNATAEAVSLAWGAVANASAYVAQLTPCESAAGSSAIGVVETFTNTSMSANSTGTTSDNAWPVEVDGSNAGINTTTTPSATATGNRMRWTASSTASIVLGPIAVDGPGAYAIQFDFWAASEVAAGHMAVEVSADGNTWETLRTLGDLSTFGSWTTVPKFSLGTLDSSELYVRFNKTIGSSSGILCVDNVALFRESESGPDWTCAAAQEISGAQLSATFSGLDDDTVYFYRVLATNASLSVGSAWSAIGHITTQLGVQPPTVAEPSTTNILSTTAMLGATVSADGGDSLTAVGVEYGTTVGLGSRVEASPLPAVGAPFVVAVEDLLPKTLYFFQGFAENAVGKGASAQETFYTMAAEPGVPSDLQISPYGTSRLDLSWTEAAGAVGYVVVRSLSSSPLGVPVDGVIYSTGMSMEGGGDVVAVVSSNRWNNTALQADTRYYYAVYAYDAVPGQASTFNYNPAPATGNGATRAPTPTAAPALVSVVTNTRRATLTWTPGEGAAGTLVAIRQTTASTGPTNPSEGVPYAGNAAFGLGDNIGSSSFVVYVGTGTSVEITGLLPETEYRFELSAVNGVNVPAYRTGATYPLLTLPSTAPLVTASGVDASYFLLNWSEVVGAAAYDVQISTTPDFSTFTSHSAIAGHSLPVGGLSAGVAYYARVSATASEDWSEILSVHAGMIPSDVTAGEIGRYGFTLNWPPAVEAATGYRVDLSTCPFLLSEQAAPTNSLGTNVFLPGQSWRYAGASATGTSGSLQKAPQYFTYASQPAIHGHFLTGAAGMAVESGAFALKGATQAVVRFSSGAWNAQSVLERTRVNVYYKVDNAPWCFLGTQTATATADGSEQAFLMSVPQGALEGTNLSIKVAAPNAETAGGYLRGPYVKDLTVVLSGEDGGGYDSTCRLPGYPRAVSGGESVQHAVTGLEPATAYFFRVQALEGADVQSDWVSGQASTLEPIAPPAHVWATNEGRYEVSVAWDAVASAVAYHLEMTECRNTAGETWLAPNQTLGRSSAAAVDGWYYSTPVVTDSASSPSVQLPAYENNGHSLAGYGNGNATSVALLRAPFSTVGIHALSISFTHSRRKTFSSIPAGVSTVEVAYSLDGGTHWTNFHLTGDAPASGSQPVLCSLPAEALGQPSVMLRFQVPGAYTGGSGACYGAHLADVAVEATTDSVGDYETASCVVATTSVAAASAREWRVTGLQPEKHYFFRVQADDGVRSGLWTEGDGWTLAGVPPPPAIWAEDIGRQKMDVAWDPSPEDGVTYRLQVTACPGEAWSVQATEPSATNRPLAQEDDWTYIGGGSLQTLSSGAYVWPTYVGSPEFSQVLAGTNSPGLMSKAFSTLGASNVVVSFQHGRWYNATAPAESILTVEYSLDGGGLWRLAGLTETAATSEFAVLPRRMELPADALDQPSVRVRIVAENGAQVGGTSRGAAVRSAAVTVEGAGGDYETAACLQLDEAGLTQLRRALTGLESDSPYWFRVQASDGISSGSWVEGTAATLALPPAPAAVWAEDIARQSFNVVWDAVSVAESYTLEVARDAAFSDLVGPARTGLTQTGARVDGLTANTVYYFRVCAVAEGLAGGWALNTATTLDSARISGLHVEDIGTNGFTVVWNQESGLAYTLQWTGQTNSSSHIQTVLSCPNQTLGRSDNGQGWFYLGGGANSPAWWAGIAPEDCGHMLTYDQPGIQSRWFSTLGLTNVVVRFDHGRFNSGNLAATVLTVQYSTDGGSTWQTAGATEPTTSPYPTQAFQLALPSAALDQASVGIRVSALAASGMRGAHVKNLEVEEQTAGGVYSGSPVVVSGGRHVVSGLDEGTRYRIQLAATDEASGSDVVETSVATRVGEKLAIASQGFDGWDEHPWAYTPRWFNSSLVPIGATTQIDVVDENPLYGDRSLRLAGAANGASFGAVEFETLSGLANFRNKQLILPFAAKDLAAGDALYFQASTNRGTTWTAYGFMDHATAGARVGVGATDEMNQNWPYNRGLHVVTRPRGNAFVWEIPQDVDELAIRVLFGGYGGDSTAAYYFLDEIKLVGESIGPLPPSPVHAESLSTGAIRLSWTPNAAQDDVIILRSADFRSAPEAAWELANPPEGYELLLNGDSALFPAGVEETDDFGVQGGMRYFYFFYSVDGEVHSHRPTMAFADAAGMVQAIASQGWDGWDLNPWSYQAGWVDNPGPNSDAGYLAGQGYRDVVFNSSWTGQVHVVTNSYYGARALGLQGSVGFVWPGTHTYVPYSGAATLTVTNPHINPTNAAVQFGNVDLSGYQNVKLQIHFSGQQASGGNDLHVAISTNNGASWTLPAGSYGYGEVIGDGSSDTETYPKDWAYYYEESGWPAGSPTPHGNPYLYDVPNSVTQLMLRIMFFDANGASRTNSFYYIDEVRLIGEPAMDTPCVRMQNITSNAFQAVWDPVVGANLYHVEVTKCDAFAVLLQESFALSTLTNGWTGYDDVVATANREGAGLGYRFNAGGRQLVSPEISGARQLQFYLRAAGQIPATGWNLAVEAAPRADAPDVEWIMVTNLTAQSGITNQYAAAPITVDLPERQRQHIRFRFVREGSAPTLYLDDIAVLGGGDYASAACLVFQQSTSSASISVPGLSPSTPYFVRVQAEGTALGGGTVCGPWGETGDTTAGVFHAAPDGFELVRMRWSATPSAPLLVVYAGPDGVVGTPAAGTSYAAGDAIAGGGTVIAYATNSTTTFEHMVPFNAEADYAVFWRKGNYYEGRLDVPIWMGRYSSAQAEAFAYTNGMNLISLDGSGKGWSGAWTVVNRPEWATNDLQGGGVRSDVTLLQSNQLFGAGGNALALYPGHALDKPSTVSVKRMFDSAYPQTAKWWGMFTMKITYTGSEKWAGIQLLDASGADQISIGKLWTGSEIGMERFGQVAEQPGVDFHYNDGDTHTLIFHWDGAKMWLAAYSQSGMEKPIISPNTPAPGQSGGIDWLYNMTINGFPAIAGVRLAAENSGSAVLSDVFFDEIRFGSTWDSLIGAGMDPPNPVSVCRAEPDGYELVRLSWTKPAAVPAASSPTGKAIPAASGVLVLNKTTPFTEAEVPMDGRVYAPGALIGGASVVCSSTGTNMEHVVQPGSTQYYRFFSYSSANVYTNGTLPLVSTPVVMGTYGEKEYVNPFSYTNNQLDSASAAAHWAGGKGFAAHTWTVSDGTWSIVTDDTAAGTTGPQFADFGGYPERAGNLARGTATTTNHTRMTRPLQQTFNKSNSSNFYVAFLMSYQSTGPQRWAGLSLYDGATERAFFGKGHGENWSTLVVEGHGIGGARKKAWADFDLIGYDNGRQNVYLVVGRYQFGSRVVSVKAHYLGVGGSSLPDREPDTWDATIQLDGDIQFDRIAIGGGGVTNVYFDEIRYGASWEDLVATTCPEAVESVTASPASVYLGDSVNVVIHSSPRGPGQHAEWKVNWVGGSETYSIPFWTHSEDGATSFWSNKVQMIQTGILGGDGAGAMGATGRVYAVKGGETCSVSAPLLPPVEVLPLQPPTGISVVQHPVQTNSALILSWNKWHERNVLVVRFTDEAQRNAAMPEQGVRYFEGSGLGGGVVVYRGNADTFTNGGLVPNTTYYYAFFSENYTYYSTSSTGEGQTADGAHDLVIDGDPTDWYGQPPEPWNSASWSLGEYIWKDKLEEERKEWDVQNGVVVGSKEVPSADLREFRVYADEEWVYFLIRMRNITDTNVPHVAIGIDTRRKDTSTGMTWLGDDASTFIGDGYFGSLAAHYPETQLGIHVVDGALQVERFTQDSWHAPESTVEGVGYAAAIQQGEGMALEVRLARADLGLDQLGSTVVTTRFTVASFLNSGVWNNQGSGTKSIDAGSAYAVDSMAISPYLREDNDYKLSAWDEGIVDGDLDFWVDVRFDRNGVMENLAPPPPLPLSPADNAETSAGLSLTWQMPTGAPGRDGDGEITSFLLEISTNESFGCTAELDTTENGPVVLRVNLPTNTMEYTYRTSSSQYWWRVRARDTAGELSTAEVRSFRVVGKLDNDGPVAELLYVGQDVAGYLNGDYAIEEQLYPEILHTVTDQEIMLANESGQMFGFVIRWKDPSGVYATNHVRARGGDEPAYPPGMTSGGWAWNILSDTGRVSPNWDLIAVQDSRTFAEGAPPPVPISVNGIITNMAWTWQTNDSSKSGLNVVGWTLEWGFNKPFHATNTYTVGNDARSITNVAHSAFQLLNFDTNISYYLTVSAEDACTEGEFGEGGWWEYGTWGSFTNQPGVGNPNHGGWCADGPNHARNITTNQLIRIYIQDNDETPPSGSSELWNTRSMLITTNAAKPTVWANPEKQLAQVQSASEQVVYHVTDGELLNRPLTFHFNVRDAYLSGLQLPSNHLATLISPKGFLVTNTAFVASLWGTNWANFSTELSEVLDNGRSADTVATWTWPNMSKADVSALWGADDLTSLLAVTNQIGLLMYDDDDNREGDQAAAQEVFGELVVVDNDIGSPVVNSSALIGTGTNRVNIGALANWPLNSAAGEGVGVGTNVQNTIRHLVASPVSAWAAVGASGPDTPTNMTFASTLLDWSISRANVAEYRNSTYFRFDLQPDPSSLQDVRWRMEVLAFRARITATGPTNLVLTAMLPGGEEVVVAESAIEMETEVRVAITNDIALILSTPVEATNAVTFRLYAYNASNGNGNIALQNLTAHGFVQIPSGMEVTDADLVTGNWVHRLMATDPLLPTDAKRSGLWLTNTTGMAEAEAMEKVPSYWIYEPKSLGGGLIGNRLYDIDARLESATREVPDGGFEGTNWVLRNGAAWVGDEEGAEDGIGDMAVAWKQTSLPGNPRPTLTLLRPFQEMAEWSARRVSGFVRTKGAAGALRFEWLERRPDDSYRTVWSANQSVPASATWSSISINRSTTRPEVTDFRLSFQPAEADATIWWDDFEAQVTTTNAATGETAIQILTNSFSDDVLPAGWTATGAVQSAATVFVIETSRSLKLAARLVGQEAAQTSQVLQECDLPDLPGWVVASLDGELWSRGGDFEVEVEFLDPMGQLVSGEILSVAGEPDWTLCSLPPVETRDTTAAKVRITLRSAASAPAYVDLMKLTMVSMGEEIDAAVTNGLPEVTLSLKGGGYGATNEIRWLSVNARQTNLYQLVSQVSDSDDDRLSDNLAVLTTNFFALYDDDDMPPQTGVMFGGPIGIRTTRQLPGVGVGRQREIRISDRDLSTYVVERGGNIREPLYLDIDGYDYSGWTTTLLKLSAQEEDGIETVFYENGTLGSGVSQPVSYGVAGFTSATNTFGWEVQEIWDTYSSYFEREIPVTNSVILAMADFDADRADDSLPTGELTVSSVVFLDNDVHSPIWGWGVSNWLGTNRYFIGTNGVESLLANPAQVDQHRLQTITYGETELPVLYDNQLRKAAPGREFFMVVNAGDPTEAVRGRSSTGLRRGTNLVDTTANPFMEGTYEVTNSFIAFSYQGENALEDALHYKAEYSSRLSSTRMLANMISNVWAWESFSYDDMGHLLPDGEFARVYDVNFHAYDADDNRPEDQMTAVLPLQSVLVRDNDTAEPTAPTNLLVNGNTPDPDGVYWTNQPTFALTFLPARDGEPNTDDDVEPSGIAEYRVHVADGSMDLAAFNALHSAQRGLTGTPYPVAAKEGMMADGGFEAIGARAEAALPIESAWTLPDAPNAWFVSTSNALEGKYALGLREGVLSQQILLDSLPTQFTNLYLDASYGVLASVENTNVPAMRFFFYDEAGESLPGEPYILSPAEEPAGAWTVVASSVGEPVPVPEAARSVQVMLSGGLADDPVFFDDIQLFLGGFEAEDQPEVPMAFTAFEQGMTTNFLFAVDRDNDRLGDRLAGSAQQFFIAYDITPPTRIGNSLAAGVVASTDDVDDPTTQFELSWGVNAFLGPDDPANEKHPTKQAADTAILSPWGSYKVYYGTFDAMNVPENDVPHDESGYIYSQFIATGAYQSWPAVMATNHPVDPSAAEEAYAGLTNMANSRVRLYDLDYDQDYVVVVVGVDQAGNEGPAGIYSWATNNTIRFAVTQGVMRARSAVVSAFGENTNFEEGDKGAVALYWIAAGQTNANGSYTRVTKEYDLIYWDAPSFNETSNSTWTRVGTVQSNWFADARGNDLSNRGQLRFYRASYKDRWRRTNAVTGRSQRPLASEDVYAMHNVVLSEGYNHVGLHGMPYTNTFAGVFGTDTNFWPSGDSVVAGATYVEFFHPGKHPSVESRYFFGSDGEWYRDTQSAATKVTDDLQPPEFFTRGFSIGLPNPLPEAFRDSIAHYSGYQSNLNAMIWRPVLKVPTNGPDGSASFKHEIQTGSGGRTANDVYNVLSLNLPVAVHPRDLNLVESGFVQGSAGTGDRLYTIDTSRKAVRENATIYCDFDGVWRFVHGGTVPEGYVKPNDMIVIISRNGGGTNNWTWTYSPSNYYTLPTRWMGE
ncbi:MAG: fibronectin type III domain-containing protein [Verrucomicrobiota bacterium]|nr:fibronectin type III domain-containing protein [Verrucomicrobiota bacterium]